VSVALLIRHAKRMRRIILQSVGYLNVQCFARYFINGSIVGKKSLSTKWVLIGVSFLYNF
jgi:hypothetical protein